MSTSQGGGEAAAAVEAAAAADLDGGTSERVCGGTAENMHGEDRGPRSGTGWALPRPQRQRRERRH